MKKVEVDGGVFDVFAPGIAPAAQGVAHLKGPGEFLQRVEVAQAQTFAVVVEQQIEEEEEEEEEELECEEYEYEGESYGLSPNGDLYTQEGEHVGKVVDGEVIFNRAAVASKRR